MPLTRADGTTPTRAEKGKARSIINRLRARYPEIGTALDYESPFQLLVVTVLSAQTTDENVNKVAPILFERYPNVGDLAEADPEGKWKLFAWLEESQPALPLGQEAIYPSYLLEILLRDLEDEADKPAALLALARTSLETERAHLLEAVEAQAA